MIKELQNGRLFIKRSLNALFSLQETTLKRCLLTTKSTPSILYNFVCIVANPFFPKALISFMGAPLMRDVPRKTALRERVFWTTI